MKAISIIGFVVMVVALALLIRMSGLFGDNVVALAIQVAAVGLMIWARVVFGRRSFHAAGNPTEGELVTSGPYRYIRHPIYAAVLYFTWAGVLTHLSPETVACGVLEIVGVAMRVYVEERYLRQRYPEYEEYANRTKRIIPFVV